MKEMFTMWDWYLLSLILIFLFGVLIAGIINLIVWFKKSGIKEVCFCTIIGIFTVIFILIIFLSIPILLLGFVLSLPLYPIYDRMLVDYKRILDETENAQICSNCRNPMASEDVHQPELVFYGYPAICKYCVEKILIEGENKNEYN